MIAQVLIIISCLSLRDPLNGFRLAPSGVRGTLHTPMRRIICFWCVHWQLQKSGKLWSHANQLSFYPLKFWVPQSQFSVETFKQPARLNRVRPLFWQTFSNQKSYSTTHTRLSLHFNLRATTEDCVIAGDTVTAVSVTVEFLLFVFICHSLQSPKRAVQNAQIVSEEK